MFYKEDVVEIVEIDGDSSRVYLNNGEYESYLVLTNLNGLPETFKKKGKFILGSFILDAGFATKQDGLDAINNPKRLKRKDSTKQNKIELF